MAAPPFNAEDLAKRFACTGMESGTRDDLFLAASAGEQTLFEASPMTAIDVYVDPGQGDVTNTKVRLYGQVQGSEYLFREVAFTFGTRGRILSETGGVERWRVAVVGGVTGYTQKPTTPLPRFSYVAYGLERAPRADAQDALPVTWVTDTDVNASAALVTNATPLSYVRQVALTSNFAAGYWLQLWDGSTRIAEAYASAIGQAVSFDFRDPHRLAPANDGYPVRSGLLVVASTTPFTRTDAPAGTHFAALAEVRLGGY